VAGPGDECLYDAELDACAWEFVTCPTCTSDKDCSSNSDGVVDDKAELFCSKGECRAVGTCSDLADCLNPANAYSMVQCVGFRKCDENNVCAVDCTTSSFCPNNDEVYCFASACEVTRCGNPTVSCVDYNCGGCYPIFFNASGYQTCAVAKLEEIDNNLNVNCPAEACGPPPPGMPILCPDGVTVTGSGTVCEYNAENGACTWGSLPCPACEDDEDCDVASGQFCLDSECTICQPEQDCGPIPPVICSNGAALSNDILVSESVCEFSEEEQRCIWDLPECTSEDEAIVVDDDYCREHEYLCGPQMGAPNFLCPDNITMGGPGGCVYYASSKRCGWEYVHCP